MADDSLKTWKEKLDFLEKEAALAVDGPHKFALSKQIEEAKKKIEELEHARERQPQAARPRFPDEETERLSVELEGLFEERERLALDEGDTRVLDRRINGVRRLLRKGPQLRAGEFLADGRFKLVENLGQGGFATVWKAYDRQHRRVVAVKVLHGQHSHERTKQERFFRGARRMAELHHPHIVDVLEKKVDDEGWLFFVMEYVAGGDFRRVVLDGTLSIGEKIDTILQMGEALAFAHGRGIVHRDVKPGNVLLEQKDGKWTAKLTDFDLVRAEDSTGFTATRAMMGTLHFAAPECLDSARDVGPPADVYSLASTAVFALRGEKLPGGYYRDPRPAVLALDVSEDLKRVLGRGTASEASERYSSVEDFSQALRDAVRPAAVVVSGADVGEVVTLRAPTSLAAAEPSQPQPGDVWKDLGTGIPLRYIPPGVFMMGSPAGEPGRDDDERQHEVKLTRGFWMGETEVTQEQWYRIMANNPSHFADCDECPVENVSWFGAVEFANRISKMAGLEACYEIRGEEVAWDRSCRGYRLPTEAEWEFAARAGTKTAYWTGPTLTSMQANFGRNVGKTTKVRRYSENPWGLYDVHGNVWEWVWDRFAEYPTNALAADPAGPPEGSERVIRGGSWNDFAQYVRSAFRYAYGSGIRRGALGFRLALGQGAPSAEPR